MQSTNVASCTFHHPPLDDPDGAVSERRKIDGFEPTARRRGATNSTLASWTIGFDCFCPLIENMKLPLSAVLSVKSAANRGSLG
jgi:hypothetical protein